MAECSCNHCGQQLEFDNSMVGVEVACPSCGKETKLFLPGNAAPTGSSDPAKGLGIASMILGICSITVVPVLTPIPAIVCGHKSRKKSKQSNTSPSGMALAGLITGYLGLIPMILGFLIILAFVMPKFAGRSKQAKTTVAKSQISNMKIAIDSFEIDMGYFPKAGNDLRALIEEPNSDNVQDWQGATLLCCSCPLLGFAEEMQYASLFTAELHWIIILIIVASAYGLIKDFYDAKTGKTQREHELMRKENDFIRFYPKGNKYREPKEVFLNAVEFREIDAVKEWLNSGINLNPENGSIGALHVSSSLGRVLVRHSSSSGSIPNKNYELSLEITKLLLNRGANINSVSIGASGRVRITPLDSCMDGMRWQMNNKTENDVLAEIMELLIDNGGKTFSDLSTEIEKICIAIKEGDPSNLEAYFKETDINIPLSPENSFVDINCFPNFLTYAVNANQHDIVQIILSKGGLMRPSGIDQNYPLHLAKDVEMAKLLISAGAEINPTNDNFDTPLDVAADDEIIDILRLNGGKTSEEL